jgi:hypothetical protein
MLFDQFVYYLPRAPIVSYLDKMFMVAYMDASTLLRIISKNVENFCITRGYTKGGSLQILQIIVEVGGGASATGKTSLEEPSNWTLFTPYARSGRCKNPHLGLWH